MTRKQIKDENDFKQLKIIGKQFRELGYVVALNTSVENLKEALLAIFDEYQKTEKDTKENIEETESFQPQQVQEEIIEKPEKSADPYDNSKLYITKVLYNDWESGWSFNPETDEPKALPKKLSHGLKAALESKRIVRFIK